jgi:hypothetical protein
MPTIDCRHDNVRAIDDVLATTGMSYSELLQAMLDHPDFESDLRKRGERFLGSPGAYIPVIDNVINAMGKAIKNLEKISC